MNHANLADSSNCSASLFRTLGNLGPAMFGLSLAALLWLPAGSSQAETPSPVKINSVYIKLLDEVHVPALESGPLTHAPILAGESVERDQLLARVDDTSARLTLERKQLDLERIRRQSENDLSVRLAAKNLEAARLELKRGVESRSRHAKSVSQTEMDELRLAADRAALEWEQAQFELRELQLAVAAGENEVLLAEHAVARRRIVAPFAGTIVERLLQRGEWVESGQAVYRLVRMDRLRAEGVVNASQIDESFVGREIRVTVELSAQSVTVNGKLTYISPEVEPVTNQVRVWAEIDNRLRALRPGMQAEMTFGQ